VQKSSDPIRNRILEAIDPHLTESRRNFREPRDRALVDKGRIGDEIEREPRFRVNEVAATGSEAKGRYCCCKVSTGRSADRRKIDVVRRVHLGRVDGDRASTDNRDRDACALQMG